MSLLQHPLYIPDSSTLELQMWRRTDDRKVWYEWLVEVYQNSTEAYVDRDGARRERTRRFKAGRSELHSSVKEACLM